MSTQAERGGGGLVIALAAEARSIGVRRLRAGECQRWRDGWVAISGIGPHGAMRAAEQLVERGVVQLASWGVAGALDPDLAPGDIVIPDRILHAMDGVGYPADPALGKQLATTLATRFRVRRGPLWSTHVAVATRGDKRDLAERSHAIAVDMESAPVAAVAQRASLPFIAVKAICDTAARDVPRAIADTLQHGNGGIPPRMLAAIVFGGPGAWRATTRLGRDFAQARRTLAIASRLVDPVATTT